MRRTVNSVPMPMMSEPRTAVRGFSSTPRRYITAEDQPTTRRMGTPGTTERIRLRYMGAGVNEILAALASDETTESRQAAGKEATAWDTCSEGGRSPPLAAATSEAQLVADTIASRCSACSCLW